MLFAHNRIAACAASVKGVHLTASFINYRKKNKNETIAKLSETSSLHHGLAPLLKCWEATFETFCPLVVARMIDVGIAEKDGPYLWKMGGLSYPSGYCRLFFSLTASISRQNPQSAREWAMRSDLFAHINTFSYQEIDTIGTSTLINRMTNDVIPDPERDQYVPAPVPPVSFCGAWSYDHGVYSRCKGCGSLCGDDPGPSAVVFAILLASMPLYQKVQKQLDQVLLNTRENLLGIRVVRAFARQKEENGKIPPGYRGICIKSRFL